MQYPLTHEQITHVLELIEVLPEALELIEQLQAQVDYAHNVDLYARVLAAADNELAYNHVE